MFICSNPKFVYISFTKSGSSSMYQALKANFSGQMIKRTRKKVPVEYCRYPSFCVVRNPYSRMVSWWWSICKVPGDRYGHKRELRQLNQPETLLGFMTLWATKNGLDQYKGIDVNGNIDHIIKLENIEDVNKLPFITTPIHIPQSNKRDHPHWKEVIDPESGRIINRLYKKDFEYFGYEMIDF